MADEQGPPPDQNPPVLAAPRPRRHFPKHESAPPVPHRGEPVDPQHLTGDIRLISQQDNIPLRDLERRQKHREALEASRIRREKAFDLWLAAVPMRRIAAQIGVAEQTAIRYVKQIRERLPVESIENRRRTMWLRLERATQGLWPQVLAGDRFAVENLVKVIDRQAKLYGLDAPLKVASTTPDGTQWAPLALALDRMSAEELMVLRKYQTLRVLPDATTEGELIEGTGG